MPLWWGETFSFLFDCFWLGLGISTTQDWGINQIPEKPPFGQRFRHYETAWVVERIFEASAPSQDKQGLFASSFGLDYLEYPLEYPWIVWSYLFQIRKLIPFCSGTSWGLGNGKMTCPHVSRYDSFAGPFERQIRPRGGNRNSTSWHHTISNLKLSTKPWTFPSTRSSWNSCAMAVN